MQSVFNTRVMIIALAGIMTMAAGFSVTARYVADGPGASLHPLGNAEQVVALIQGHENILWKSMMGTVTNITVMGWPVNDGEVELGGGLTITRPDGGEAGIIDFGEPPMSVDFDLAG